MSVDDARAKGRVDGPLLFLVLVISAGWALFALLWTIAMLFDDCLIEDGVCSRTSTENAVAVIQAIIAIVGIGSLLRAAFERPGQKPGYKAKAIITGVSCLASWALLLILALST